MHTYKYKIKNIKGRAQALRPSIPARITFWPLWMCIYYFSADTDTAVV